MTQDRPAAMFVLAHALATTDSSLMRVRRATGGLGIGAGLSFVLLHAVHVLALSAPAAVGAAVSFVCHIR